MTADSEKRAVLEALCRLPAAIPDFVNSYEPVNKPFAPDNLDQAVALWRQFGFLWRRRKSPKYSGSAWSDSWDTPAHGWVTADLPMKSGQSLATDLVRILCERLFADFGMVHLPCQDREQELMTATNTGGNLVMVASHVLQRFLPDLYWLTIFGPPYVDHFGRERLLSVPAFRVEELPYGGIWIQLSESPLDFLEDYDRVNAVRQRAKEHLDRDSFFNLEYWYAARGVRSIPEYIEKRQDLVIGGTAPPGEHRYNVPDFRLRERRRELGIRPVRS